MANTNWTADGWNRVTNVVVYQRGDGKWMARHEATKEVCGPFRLRREARLGSYALIHGRHDTHAARRAAAWHHSMFCAWRDGQPCNCKDS